MNIIKKILLKTNGWPIKSFYAGVGTILALHRVLPASDKLRIRNHGLEITPENLEELIEFFRSKNYDFISIEELKGRLKSKTKNKFVIFTFDDGYVDNYEIAFPIFKTYNIPFTIYLANNFVKKKRILWWYALEDLLLSNESINFEFSGRLFNYDCKTCLSKESVFSEIRNLFTSLKYSQLLELEKNLFKEQNNYYYKLLEKQLLNSKMIDSLNSSNLVTLGAHTYNHLSLNSLEKNNFLYEVEASKYELEMLLGKKVNHFSYPFGTKNEVGLREFEWVKELGFETAVTGRRGNIHLPHYNHMTALPRFYIEPGITEELLYNFVSGLTPCITGLKKRVIVD